MRLLRLAAWLCAGLTVRAAPLQGDVNEHIIAQSQVAFDDPAANKGSMLSMWDDFSLTEPLNVIISAKSSKNVLAPSVHEGGIYNYIEALGYGGQCFGLHMGGKQIANLGDGQGNQTQMSMLRYQYFRDPYFGTCIESILGGSHFRLFRQASTKAYFLAASVEKDAWEAHEIAPNGYDLNRDYIVGNATNHRVTKADMTSQFRQWGIVEKRGWRYNTTAEWVDGLVPRNRTLINHYARVQAVGGNVTDGWTALLTVTATRVDEEKRKARSLWRAVYDAFNAL